MPPSLRAAAPALRPCRCLLARPVRRPAALVRHHSTPSSSTTSSSSSVSPDEVAHFNALASSWWDPYGPSRLLHQMNPLRHDFIRACIDSSSSSSSPSSPSPSTPRTYLDVGCGGGIFAESAARLPATAAVTAIDPSADVLAVARAHARRDPLVAQRLRYRQASVEDLVAADHEPNEHEPAHTHTYDVVTLFEVLEHVATDPASFLARCGRLVRPGGWLVLSTMARTWTSWLTTIVAAEDVLGIVPRGTHDWRKYVNADELAACFPAPGTTPTAAAASAPATWHNARFQGVAYVPGLGWQVVPGGEKLGNYFFGIQKTELPP